MKSCNKKLQAWHTMGGLPSTCEAHNSCWVPLPKEE
jgi:hypothetical protein